MHVQERYERNSFSITLEKRKGIFRGKIATRQTNNYKICVKSTIVRQLTLALPTLFDLLYA